MQSGLILIFALFNNVKKIIKLVLGRASIVDITPPITFVGWKLATGTCPPWEGGGSNLLAIAFAKCDQLLFNHIVSRRVILTQFQQSSVEIEVAQLRWRHYIVYWSATVASRLSCEGLELDSRNFVEMGVCDGLTAWYASKARQEFECGGEFFLFDAWEGMRPDLLTAAEGGAAGSYSYLDLENTKSNLAFCGRDKFIFVKGYIPESFSRFRNPKKIAWMHIDLNSSIPTIASLNFFWDRLLPGGLILLDDFAWPGYGETKSEVEKWCEARCINIFQFPTGQALITKPV
jgi:O-methyltransferase